MFRANILSLDEKEIRSALLNVLNQTVDKGIKQLDDRLRMSSDEEKHQIFSEFETRGMKKATKDPQLLKKWVHYCWIQSELSYLASQRAILNKIQHFKKEFSDVPKEKILEIPAIAGSVCQVIQGHASSGLTIEQSIQKLRQIGPLQIVSTEHPTDPLSDEARVLLLRLVTQIENEKIVKETLAELNKIDAIPKDKRTVSEEINRNIFIALEKSFTALPYFIEAILSAYEQCYGKDVLLAHETDILLALGGGIQPNGRVKKPIVQDAVWPGFDADGNDNVTAKSMHEAIFKMRHHIISKYIEIVQSIYGDIIQIKRLKPLMESLKYIEGALQEELNNLKINPRAIALQSDKDIILFYKNILQDNEVLLNSFPALRRHLYYLRIQFDCFGLTFGSAHIRQDASVHVNVWTMIFENIKVSPQLQNNSVLSRLKKSYKNLNDDERMVLHRILQNGSSESQAVLAEINMRYREKHYENKEFALINRELGRYEFAVQYQEMIENIIIANTKSIAHMLEVESFLRVFSAKPWSMMIVPLIEERQDLANLPSILNHLIKLKIEFKIKSALLVEENKKESILRKIVGDTSNLKTIIQEFDAQTFSAFRKKFPALNVYLRDITVEIMFAYSDTERASGIGVLLSIKKAQEHFITLCQYYGVQPKIFYGAGGDINRGGLGRQDPKGTLQGNARSNILSHPLSALRFREKQFYHAVKSYDSKMEITQFYDMQESLKQFEKNATGFYEFLHGTEEGLGKLVELMLGHGPHWMVTNILNSSSRKSNRGGEDKPQDRTKALQKGGVRPAKIVKLEGLRAISATQMKELLRDYIHLLGPGYGFRQLGLGRAQRIYDCSSELRDIFNKTLLTLAKTKLSIAAYALFGDEESAQSAGLRPRSREERIAWANCCRKEYPELLKKLDIEKAMQNEQEKNMLIIMMSRLFAFIENEIELSSHFMFAMVKRIHIERFKELDAPKNFKKPIDLLYAHTSWKEYVSNMYEREGDALSILLVRINRQVLMGESLDVVYDSLNNGVLNNELSGIAGLLGSLGAALRVLETMPPPFCDDLIRDDNGTDLRPGVGRAETLYTFFGKVKSTVAIFEEALAKKQSNNPERPLISRL